MDGDALYLLDRWHHDELVRLGFDHAERQHLTVLIDEGEISLQEIRDLIEKRGWSPRQAFASAA